MKINLTSSSISPSFVGFLVLKEFKKAKVNRISIYELADKLKKHGIISSRQLILGLSFLFSVNIVDFEEAQVWLIE